MDSATWYCIVRDWQRVPSRCGGGDAGDDDSMAHNVPKWTRDTFGIKGKLRNLQGVVDVVASVGVTCPVNTPHHRIALINIQYTRSLMHEASAL